MVAEILSVDDVLSDASTSAISYSTEQIIN